MSKAGRPHGVRNAKPSRAAIQSYYRLLSTAADEGDINAAGWLLTADKLDSMAVTQEREANQRRLRDADGDVVAHNEATRRHLAFELDHAE